VPFIIEFEYTARPMHVISLGSRWNKQHSPRLAGLSIDVKSGANGRDYADDHARHGNGGRMKSSRSA
jgi:hypothetical protein